MNLIMIASSYYPISNVSSIRIHSYCKALSDYGSIVKVYNVYPDQVPYQGSYEGVVYSAFYNEKRSANVLGRIIQRVKGAKEISQYIIDNDVKVILSYHDNLLTNIILKTVLRYYGLNVPLVIDKTEYPYGYYKMNQIQKYICKLPLKIYDGFIVISEELKRWYSNINNNVFVLPMTINPNRFANTFIQQSPPYIAVTFGTHNRDGLATTIEAYRLYCKRCQNPYNLMLIGDFDTLVKNHNEISDILKIMSSPLLKDKIVVKGLVPINDVPQLLRNAKILLTTSSGYNSGGFPTKLGEYMLSGVPVVATDVGEISLFLKHRYDILLARPGDVHSIVDNLMDLQFDALLSDTIARNAYQTAITVFNADTYCKDMLDYFDKIISNNY